MSPGTREEQLDALRTKVATCDAFVIAASLLTATPLYVAALFGLVI